MALGTAAFIMFIFLCGAIAGSFLNVCIYRLPLGVDVVWKSSSCIHCGCRLRWFDMIPILNWFILKGRCRCCKGPISIQYPIIELLNGILWVETFLRFGFSFTSLWYGACISALLVLSVIDWRTYKIPIGCNLWIFGMGAGNLFTECMAKGLSKAGGFLAGAFVISGFLELIAVLTKGRAIGGGDIKLTFAAGLLLGWKGILWAFLIGCIAGSLIHPIFIKWKNKERILAFGPYLSFGIWVSMMWGQQLSDWYAGYLFG
ncbi:prepilin peptidase [Lachnospiraceae bacterium 62-35]